MPPSPLDAPHCSRCGAPVEVLAPELLHGAWELHCPYCQAREALPAEAEERARTLRFREELLRQAQRASEVPAIAYAQIARAWSSPLTIGLALVVVISAVVQGLRAVVSAQGAGLPGSLDGWITLVVGACMVPGVLAIMAGALAGRSALLESFRRVAAPVLMARPPAMPGQGLCCRVCTAPLPGMTNGLVTCGFCQATNLVDAKLAGSLKEHLEQETFRTTEALKARLAPLSGESAPGRVFLRRGVLVGFLCFVPLFFGQLALLVAVMLVG